MKRIVLFLVVCLVAAGALGAAIAQAANPAGPPAQPPGPTSKAQPLENGPATKPGPVLTGPPSAPVAIDPHWRANVRANTDTGGTQYAQQEPSIGVNPTNPLNVVAAQKDERSAPGPGTATKEVWIDTSTDGGLTWPVNVPIPMPDSSLPQQSDPVVTFSDNNNVFITIIGLSDAGGIGTNTVMVARSTDGGLTWPTPAVRLNPGQGGSDKEWTNIDLNPSSPYYHRLYTTWTNFAAGPAFIEKWSSDFGVTWNPPGTSYVTVSYDPYNGNQFSMPVVLPNGTVLATWNAGSVIAVGKSTDGGQSFINPNTTAVGIANVNSVPGAAWRVNTIPSTAVNPSTGTVITVWADGSNGKDDIYFTRSTDGGTTWSTAARVAHNAAGSSYQVEPWISVAPNGRWDVVWYDDRDFPSNLNTFHVYATHSTDDGATWTGPDEQVTDAATNLNTGIPTGSGWNNAAGDYIGVASANNVAYAVWTDTRSGTNEDVYTSAYTPPAQGTPTPTATGTPPTATQTRTATNTPTPTVTACATNLQNGGFETGDLSGWTILGTNPPPVASNAAAHSGTYSALVGTVSGPEPNGDGSMYQTISVPSSGGTLSFWWNGGTTDSITYDWQDAYITDTSGNILATIMHNCQTTNGWINQTLSLAPYAGQTVRVEFLVHQDGFGDDTYMYVDDVQLQVSCASPTPGLPTSTPTTVPPTDTATSVPPSSTPTSVPASATATSVASSPTPTETVCPVNFSDVHPTDYFYEPVRYLYCHGVISGYGDGTFRPYNDTTRAQMVKIVVLGFGIPVQTPAGGAYTFHDVPPAAPFFDVIETAAAHNIISGYNCGPGGPGPCDPQNRGYFLPNNPVTRGQLSKIDVIAAGWPQLNPTTPTFTDVPPSNPFYAVIETAVCHGVVSGYADHTFHPFANATRGQISKIVYLSILDQPGSCAVTPTAR